MKKKVLAVFMAVFVTVGTVLAPAETGSEIGRAHV